VLFFTAVHIEKRGLYYYLEYGSFRVRWNNGSTWFLTIEDDVYKKRPSPVKGICGNFDGDATSRSRHHITSGWSRISIAPNIKSQESECDTQALNQW